MANKKNKIKQVKNIVVDELVNEEKHVDTVNTSDIIVEHTEDVIEDEVTESTEVADNIDDVISECTGELETNTEEFKKENEPWYVAKAKRIYDYYNW